MSILSEVGSQLVANIDMRSDTVTMPTEQMRMAMAQAEVGDDVMQEDPTVNKLEAHVADLLGKEAAVFVCSGTMGNLIAQMAHCESRMSEVLAGDQSHTVLCEAGGSAICGGIHVRQMPTNDDGTVDLDIVRSMIRTPNVHHPITRLVVLENTHNFKGGRVLPLEYLHQMQRLCKERGVALHCDGARLWNAAVALQQPPHILAAPFDTLCVCLSKGLGAPVGSVLVGPRDFIQKARHIRKMLGGGMRQAGVVAAAGLVAVTCMRDRLAEDHLHARQFAEAVAVLGCEVLHVVQTNIVIFRCDKVVTVPIADVVAACKAKGLLLLTIPGTPADLRVVMHNGVSDNDVTRAITIMREVIDELRQ